MVPWESIEFQDNPKLNVPPLLTLFSTFCLPNGDVWALMGCGPVGEAGHIRLFQERNWGLLRLRLQVSINPWPYPLCYIFIRSSRALYSSSYLIINRHWSEEGLAYTKGCLVKDIDDTAMGFRLLRLHGYDHVSPCKCYYSNLCAELQIEHHPSSHGTEKQSPYMS